MTFKEGETPRVLFYEGLCNLIPVNFNESIWCFLGETVQQKTVACQTQQHPEHGIVQELGKGGRPMKAEFKGKTAGNTLDASFYKTKGTLVHERR